MSSTETEARCPRPSRRAPASTWGLVALVSLASLAAGCSVHEVQRGAALDRRTPWVLLPLRNETETAQAGEKAEAILGTLLRVRGLERLAPYQPPPEPAGEIPELDERRRAERALA